MSKYHKSLTGLASDLNHPRFGEGLGVTSIHSSTAQNKGKKWHREGTLKGRIRDLGLCDFK